MKPGFLRATLAVVLVSSTRLAPERPTFADLFGRWKVAKMVGATPITGDQKSAGQPIGTTISISADRITTYEDSGGFCRPRNPKVTLVDTEAELQNNWGTKITGLYLPRGVVKAQLPLMDAGCVAALILDHNTLLWTMGNGYIYTVKRQPR